ncbi:MULTISPECIES: PQQ-dependent sugar dehydrogenase [unclassified Pseudomonas]|uniref:PQQ-dependent sugar dehydrogenase n=1 Tax=unclassified Pseudomonas TaxID=196821 RepID=UPI001B321753|nr:MULTISPECIES: sorbosone dehydrogenase family protein [unclassified Pseudomonas]MBP5944620.1 sorbosone dehydrogenase family protein [Pseudomonas sp. P9(2020)]MBZ9561171.1 sorbosone dehydrogenase family protein [Pseudomonas sp. P116]
MRKPQLVFVIALAGGLTACGESSSLQVIDGTGPSPKLPEPNKTLIPTVNIAPAVGWPAGGKPTAAAGTQVAAFAEGLDHPRWLYVLPNGDVLVAETNAPPKPDDSKGVRGWVMEKVMGKAGAGVPSPNRITLLRDADHDGVAETRTVFLQNLNSPFGMTLVGNDLYVADTDRLLRFNYEPGTTEIKTQPIKVVDLPGGTLNHHWTKNVIASKDGSKLYVTVGSNSNVGENGLDKEEGRAAIWEVDRATGNHRIFASGIRNPNGLAWEPTSGALWTAVNERDEIGSDLVPDYITSVKDGGFYGWPFSYYGQHVDVRVEPQNPDLVAKAIAPDYAVGPHTASLGLTFAEGNKLPAQFKEGAFIGQHGSWNRKPHSGYKVIFVPFAAGKPTGQPVDVLSGFLDKDENALGRPVGVVIDQQGDLLVADDVGNKVWRVSSAK